MLKVLQSLDVYRVEIAVHVDYYSYCNCSLCCCHTNAEKSEYISLEMFGMAIGIEYGKVDVHSIEHKLCTDEQ